MKNIIFLYCLMFSLNGFSQSASVQSAANSLKFHELAKAKGFIDEAAQNETTSNDPKMWFYMGRVYMEIAKDSVLDTLDLDAPEKSARGFINCIKTDKKSYYTDSTNIYTWVSGRTLYNKAVRAYNKNDLERSERFYKMIYEVFPYDKDENLKRNNITPDIVTKNLYLVANRAKDNSAAKGYLQKLIDNKYNDPNIYLYMSRIHLEEKDTGKALIYIDQGRKIFDENSTLASAEMNIYLAQGKLNILIDKVTEQMNNSPDNEILYYKRALLYEAVNNVEKAEEDYRKALEIRDLYYEANNDLGILLFNQAALMANAANNLKSTTEFEAAKKKFEAKFKAAEPFLEKSVELNPKKTEEDLKFYKVALTSLKNIYARTGQNDKYEKVKALLDK